MDILKLKMEEGTYPSSSFLKSLVVSLFVVAVVAAVVVVTVVVAVVSVVVAILAIFVVAVVADRCIEGQTDFLRSNCL